MYTRGQFAIIGKITIKALRLYDEMGLLKPVHVDVNNQYKYYSLEQVDEIMFINELKAYGFSLGEIKDIKDKNDSIYLKEKLSQRFITLESEAIEISRIKEEVSRKISFINSETVKIDKIIEYSIRIEKLNEMNVVSSRERINIQDAGKLIGRIYENIYKYSLTATDSHMIIFHEDRMDMQTDNFDIEVIIPVNKSVNLKDFCTKTIESKTYAVTKHSGGFSQVGKAHAAVIDWINKNNYEISGPPMEKYITPRQSAFNKESFEIEVYYPVNPIKRGEQHGGN